MTCAGLLLAAGGGRRMGTPKALIRDSAGTAWAQRATTLLTDGGCAPVLVVLGAAADEVRPLLPADAVVVVATDWAEGMSASLRAGLSALSACSPPPDAVLVLLVDLPDLVPDVVRRLVEQAAPGALARATYGDEAEARHGHPVLLGREHWSGVAAAASGDRGARDYLTRHVVTSVDCSDLAAGGDVDVPTGAGTGAVHGACSDGDPPPAGPRRLGR